MPIKVQPPPPPSQPWIDPKTGRPTPDYFQFLTLLVAAVNKIGATLP